MIAILKNEFLKYFNGKFIIYSFLSIFSVVLITLIRMLSGSAHSNYIKDMTLFLNPYNVESGIMNLVIPIITIVITSSTISEDYESGSMKFSLISKIEKFDILLGKIFFIFLAIIMNIVLIFITNSIVSGLVEHNFLGIFSKEYLNLFAKYIFSSISVLPICLFTIFICLIFNEFQKSITLSIVTFFLLCIITNLFTTIKFLIPTYNIINLMFLTTKNSINIYYSLISILIYSIIFLSLDIIIIKRKDFWI